MSMRKRDKKGHIYLKDNPVSGTYNGSKNCPFDETSEDYKLCGVL